jgi:hypothetical protein
MSLIEIVILLESLLSNRIGVGHAMGFDVARRVARK